MVEQSSTIELFQAKSFEVCPIDLPDHCVGDVALSPIAAEVNVLCD